MSQEHERVMKNSFHSLQSIDWLDINVASDRSFSLCFWTFEHLTLFFISHLQSALVCFQVPGFFPSGHIKHSRSPLTLGAYNQQSRRRHDWPACKYPNSMYHKSLGRAPGWKSELESSVFPLNQGYSIGGPRSGTRPRRNQIWTEAKINILM